MNTEELMIALKTAGSAEMTHQNKQLLSVTKFTFSYSSECKDNAQAPRNLILSSTIKLMLALSFSAPCLEAHGSDKF